MHHAFCDLLRAVPIFGLGEKLVHVQQETTQPRQSHELSWEHSIFAVGVNEDLFQGGAVAAFAKQRLEAQSDLADTRAAETPVGVKRGLLSGARSPREAAVL